LGGITARSARVSRGSVQKRFGFHPTYTAILQFQHFGRFYAPAARSLRLRAEKKGLILQRFSTLRVAKKKCFGFGFGSSLLLFGNNLGCQTVSVSRQVGKTNLFSFAFGER
jgi:hypothetical protein